MLCLSGNSPCLNGGACTDGIGSFTCACAAGFCGLTCADPLDASQNGGQCPCEDDPAWEVDPCEDDGDTCMVTCISFSRMQNRDHAGVMQACSQLTDAAGVTAQDACPNSCQNGCALTYDDCCALPH